MLLLVWFILNPVFPWLKTFPQPTYQSPEGFPLRWRRTFSSFKPGNLLLRGAKKKKEPHSRRSVFGITSQDVVVADATANECEVKERRFTCQFFARLAALAVAHPTIFAGICPGCQPKIVSRRCLRRQQIRNSLLAERVDLGWLCCKRWVGEGNAWITDK